MKTRQLTKHDWAAAKALYAQLSTKAVIEDERHAFESFDRVLQHPGTTIFGVIVNDDVRAMVTLHLLPNVTNGARPYGVIENVVTDHACRGLGLGKAAMQAAIDAAFGAGAYKVMLLTGRHNAAIGFYEKLGFSADEKQGMILRCP